MDWTCNKRRKFAKRCFRRKDGRKEAKGKKENQHDTRTIRGKQL